MEHEAGLLLDLLQLIVLTVTAILIVLQFTVRLFIRHETEGGVGSEVISSREAADSFRAVQLSAAMFVISGSLALIFLMQVTTPDYMERTVQILSGYLKFLGIIMFLSVILIALAIKQKDVENLGFGRKAIVVSFFLSGSFSLLLLILYGSLWTLSRSSQLILFITLLTFSIGMFSFLFGIMQLGNRILDLLDEGSK